MPAGGRLVRVVSEPYFHSHVGLTSANPTLLRPAFLQSYFTLAGGGYSTRQIAHNIETPLFAMSAVTDPPTRLNNRAWFITQSAGTRHWGLDTECSYGGDGRAAMTVTYHMDITTPGGAQAISFYLYARLRALYVL